MGKFKDLTGQKFNQLTAICNDGDGYWTCVCKCGRVKHIRGYELTHDRIKSCGLCGHRSDFIDLTGQTFGEWVVRKYATYQMWECECSCGKISNVNSAMLRSGRSKSCGHATNGFKDLTGQIFGEWKVISYEQQKKWMCQCMRCGKMQVNDTSALRRGLTNKCMECAAKDRVIKMQIGAHYGEWEILKESPRNGYWECKCSCGRVREVFGHTLRSGESKCCGSCNKTDEQVDIFRNEEFLAMHLDWLSTELGHKPSSYEIAESLGFNYNSVNKKLTDCEELRQLVDVGMVHTSKIEKELIDFIKSIYKGIVLERQRGLLADTSQEVDIYIPEKKIAIEFNGTYWHSTEFKSKEYHQNKTLSAIKNEITLIHIFEHEWRLNKDKVKAYLRDTIYIKRRVGARETLVCSLSIEEKTRFIEENHLQGDIASSINIGIKTKDGELIGAMTFGKPRFTTEYQFELLRLVFKSGVLVIGGSEKLFGAFIDNYKPESIISFCNIAKFNGRVYSRLGFKQIDKVTSPNYVWAKPNGEVLSRYKTTKQSLIAKGFDILGDTEDQIMQARGFYKVYDSGNLKFVWLDTKTNGR